MSGRPGQDSGHGFDWGAYVGWLVAEWGALAAVADRLSEQRGHVESVESVERGLRRLRDRGTQGGGSWGTRCLRHFGVPQAVERRVRWMGEYHSRFSDLPVPLCHDLLRQWDRPPVSESPARVWVQLGLASVALRMVQSERAREHLARAAPAAVGPSRVEWLLSMAYLESRGDRVATEAHLDEAEALLAGLTVDPSWGDWTARLVDHRGFWLNAVDGDHAAALALYDGLPEQGSAFSRVRRHNGMGWSLIKLGRLDEALDHARLGVVAAGDGGALRLRVMALKLLARASTGEESIRALARAQAIAASLDDETLRLRLS